MRLYARYREAEVHRKALVFQKQYLKCQVDAFFQTQQAALVMMADMGATFAKEPKSKSPSYHLFKFKTAVHTVVAVFRFQYVVRRKEQYIQSYSNRIEKEKTNLHVHHCPTTGVASSIKPSISVAGIVNSGVPPKHQPNNSAATTTSSIPHTLSALTQSKNFSTKLKLSSMQSGLYSQSNCQPTTSAEPQLSTYIPSLARLQARLS